MPRSNPKDQARATRKNAIRASQDRAKRRGIYVLISIVLIAVIAGGVGWYLYVSGQSANTPSIVYATIYTSKGPINVELFQSKTPKTVANFVNLARTGFYNNLVWHRIAPGFVIQTGDPNTRSSDNSTWGRGNGPQYVPTEIDSSLHNDRGTLGMAYASDPPGASSQFYVNLSDTNRQLDGKYAVFGQVVGGMSVVDALAALPIYSSNQPIDPSQAMMLNVTITSGT